MVVVYNRTQVALVVVLQEVLAVEVRDKLLLLEAQEHQDKVLLVVVVVMAVLAIGALVVVVAQEVLV